jgi:DNA-binding response OmpR family regulator
MRILFVDNHAEFTATVVASFLRAHDVVIVPTIVAAKHCVQESRFDVVLVDYDLDDGKGDELVRWLRHCRIDVPVVAVSAKQAGNEALVSAGADAACAKLAFATIETVLAPWSTRGLT